MNPGTGPSPYAGPSPDAAGHSQLDHSHVDGNALAGPLSELFRSDMTLASGRCSGCGDASVLAVAMVYESAMGAVVRCSHCGDVLLTIVEAGDSTRLDLRGITGLHLPR